MGLVACFTCPLGQDDEFDLRPHVLMPTMPKYRI